jgi:hypothetical protein
MMTTKDELLEKYDKPNQDTKRAIIEHLWRYPDTEHDAESVFRAIKDECRAQKASTVRNNLSDLSSEESIKQESRSFYRWEGEGRPHPNRRLRDVSDSMQLWMASLSFSGGVLIIAFLLWIAGVAFGVGSLIALFASNDSGVGSPFFLLFVMAGTATLLGSGVVMVWVPLYLLDSRHAG